MRKTIARTLTIGALLAIPFAGVTAAGAATAKAPAAKPVTGVVAIAGHYTMVRQPDDMNPRTDTLDVNKDGSFRIGGKTDNLYDCYGVVKAVGGKKYVFSMHCEDGFNGTAKAEAGRKGIAIHFGRGETFTR
jgi:hypothetical protein